MGCCGRMVSKVGVFRLIVYRTALLDLSGSSGYVVSDWGATHDSAAENANAGLDMEQPGDFILIGEFLCFLI